MGFEIEARSKWNTAPVHLESLEVGDWFIMIPLVPEDSPVYILSERREYIDLRTGDHYDRNDELLVRKVTSAEILED